LEMAEERGLVSVIILNYNGRHLLGDCLESIFRQDYPRVEVIVADNASDDDSVDYLKERFPEVRVIRHAQNYGFSMGNNIAAKQAEGEFLFFLNNDTRLDPRCIAELVVAAELKGADVLGCSVTDFEGRVPPRVMGIDFMGFPFYGRFFYVEGCAIFFRRDSFEELGGFDEDYFMFFEDLDICWRARLKGKRIICVEGAVVYHMGGATLFGGNPEHRGYTTNYQRRYLGERNNLRTLLKNYKFQTLLVVLPVYFMINILEVMVLLVVSRDNEVTYCYIKAYRDNIKSLRHILGERREVQAARIVGDWEILRHMSLIPSKLKMLLKVGVPIIR